MLKIFLLRKKEDLNFDLISNLIDNLYDKDIKKNSKLAFSNFIIIKIKNEIDKNNLFNAVSLYSRFKAKIIKSSFYKKNIDIILSLSEASLRLGLNNYAKKLILDYNFIKNNLGTLSFREKMVKAKIAWNNFKLMRNKSDLNEIRKSFSWDINEEGKCLELLFEKNLILALVEKEDLRLDLAFFYASKAQDLAEKKTEKILILNWIADLEYKRKNYNSSIFIYKNIRDKFSNIDLDLSFKDLTSEILIDFFKKIELRDLEFKIKNIQKKITKSCNLSFHYLDKFYKYFIIDDFLYI
jgi:hypothetical protein